MTPHAIDPVVQRDISDCGIAALAMLSGRPYREVSEVALGISPVSHRSGLWLTELRRISERIGCPLAPRRGVDVEDTGLLVLKKRKGQDRHYVVLFQGVVVDPASGLIWDKDTFLEQGNWTQAVLLEPVE